MSNELSIKDNNYKHCMKQWNKVVIKLILKDENEGKMKVLDNKDADILHCKELFGKSIKKCGRLLHNN